MRISIKNIINYERYIVEEILNFVKSNYQPYEITNALGQIRGHLINGHAE